MSVFVAAYSQTSHSKLLHFWDRTDHKFVTYYVLVLKKECKKFYCVRITLAYRELASNVNVELSNDGRCKKGFKIG